jgi:hypothetical protein
VGSSITFLTQLMSLVADALTAWNERYSFAIPQLLSSIVKNESWPQTRYALHHSPGSLPLMVRFRCVLESQSQRNRYAIDVGLRNWLRYVCPRNFAAQGRAGGHPRIMIVRKKQGCLVDFQHGVKVLTLWRHFRSISCSL